MGIVYMATCTTNGKNYIGKTIMSIIRRIGVHKSMAKNGAQSLLHRAIRKHGWNNFDWTVLFTSSDNQCLLDAERELISAWNSFGPRGYNMTAGGEGSLGYKHTPDAIEKISKSQKGKIQSEWVRQRTRETWLGRKHTPETLAKMSAAHKGKPLSKEHKEKLKIAQIGRVYKSGYKLSDETKAKLSVSHKGKPKNAEWRRKIKESNIRTKAIRRPQKIAKRYVESMGL